MKKSLCFGFFKARNSDFWSSFSSSFCFCFVLLSKKGLVKNVLTHALKVKEAAINDEKKLSIVDNTDLYYNDTVRIAFLAENNKPFNCTCLSVLCFLLFSKCTMELML